MKNGMKICTDVSKSELEAVKLTPFQKQDIFHKAMITAYLDGQIKEPMFKPYFDWKLGKTVKIEVSRIEAQAIINKASEMLEPAFLSNLTKWLTWESCAK